MWQMLSASQRSLQRSGYLVDIKEGFAKGKALDIWQILPI